MIIPNRIGKGLCSIGCALAFSFAATAADEGWLNLFDGKSMSGWKAGENTNSWKLEDGVLVAHGNRSHLFYLGDAQPFKDFEFEAEVQTKPGSNGGIFFHTQWQETDWPKQGMEVQVNNTFTKDPIKTGSLYQLKDVFQSAAKDNEWFKLYFKVVGKQITIKVNGKTVVEYTEPADKKPQGSRPRMFNQGTFALQAHDPGSTVLYRNIRVKKL